MSQNNDEEKGYKWWIRYVFVPLMGGGGIIAIIVALLSLREPTPIFTPTPNLAIQTIDFNYVESPIEHGWYFSESIDTSQIVFNPLYESANISGVEVNSSIKWGMDFDLEPATKQFGRVLEFVVIPRKDAAIYTFINISKSDGTHSTGWLKFTFCDGDVEPILRDNSGSAEWRVCLSPFSHDDNWLLFRVQIIDEVKKTFSADGWSFQGLNKIRVRGNLSLDYFSIYEQ